MRYSEVSTDIPVNIYLFKFNNRNTKKMWNKYKVNDKNTKRRQWCLSGVFIVDFEHVNVSWDNNDFKTFLVNVPFPDQRIRISEVF